MKQLILNNKKWIGYTLYCIFLVAAFLYLLFPKDALNNYIQSAAGKYYPGLIITSKKLSLSFPLGLNLFQTAVSTEENPERLIFKADKISLRPRLWSLFKKSSEYYFDCTAYNGNLKGNTIINKDDTNTSFSSSIEFQDIRIDKNSPVPSIISDRLEEGTFKGTITYEGGNDISLTQGSGEAVLTITEGLVKLAEPVFTLTAVDFDEILLSLSLKKQKLSVSQAELKGDKMIGNASGTINLNSDFMESRLNLKGEVEPMAALFQNVPGAADAVNLIKKSLKDGKLPFSLKGTIKNPQINFI